MAMVPMSQPQGEGQPAPAGDAQGAMGGLVQGVMKGLNMFGQALEKGGAPAPVLDRVSGLIQEFQGIIEELSNGAGEEQPPARQAEGTTSPEQGGNPGAVPAGMNRRG
jgi:hypothetical protein